MCHICIYNTRRMRRIRRVIFRDLICMASFPLLPYTTRDNTDPFGGYILPACEPSTNGAAAVPRTPLETTTSSGGVK